MFTPAIIPGEYNSLTAWINQHDCFIGKDDRGRPVTNTYTHLLLSGGRLDVPDALNDGLLTAILQSGKIKQEPIYIVEMPTLDGYKLFCELDLILDSHVLTREDIRKYILYPIQKMMRKIYPEKDTTVVVCMSPPKKVTSKTNNGPAIKNGIHLIWPNIIVNRSIAWRVRGALLTELSSTGIPSEWGRLHEPWDTILDGAVFDKNGLRMIWARKASICPVCKGEKTKGTGVLTTSFGEIGTCAACLNAGKIDEGRPYEFADIYTFDGNEAHDEEERCKYALDYMLQIKLTSIRVIPRVADISQLCEPAIDQYLATLSAPFMAKAKIAMKRKAKSSIFDMEPTEIIEGGKIASASATPSVYGNTTFSKNQTLEYVEYSDPAYDAICKYSSEVLNAPPATLKKNSHGHVYLLSTKSKVCLNKGGSHGSSTVYYVFRIEGVYQRCWCKKGSCPNYQSPCMPYEEGRKIAMLDALFAKSYVDRFLPQTAESQVAKEAKRKTPKKIGAPDFKPIQQMFTSSSSSNAPPISLADMFSLIKKTTEHSLQTHLVSVDAKSIVENGKMALEKLKALSTPPTSPQ